MSKEIKIDQGTKAHVEREEPVRRRSDDEKTAAEEALAGGTIQNPLRVSIDRSSEKEQG